MSDTAQETRRSDAAQRVITHAWRSPLPGQGNVKVCKTCGARFNEDTKNAACAGRSDDQFYKEEDDYEPLP